MIMNNTVYTKTFSPPAINRSEILRYAGVKKSSHETDVLLESCLDNVLDKLTYKVCYAHFPLSFCGECTNLSFTTVNSTALKKNLKDCSSYVLFAATIGVELDRLIARYTRISPAKALMIQSIGSERIESLCNTFNDIIFDEARKVGKSTAPRFSPGYGDLPIELQQDFFRVLDPYRKIGLSLNESFLMSPTKSVTAIIGISDKQVTPQKTHCTSCNKTDCTFRRTL